MKRGAKSPSFRVELAGHEAQRSGENPGRFFEATFPTAGRDPKGADKPRRSGGLSACRKDFFDKLSPAPGCSPRAGLLGLRCYFSSGISTSLMRMAATSAGSTMPWKVMVTRSGWVSPVL